MTSEPGRLSCYPRRSGLVDEKALKECNDVKKDSVTMRVPRLSKVSVKREVAWK